MPFQFAKLQKKEITSLIFPLKMLLNTFFSPKTSKKIIIFNIFAQEKDEKNELKSYKKLLIVLGKTIDTLL